MYVSDLAVDNFRSYRQAVASFTPGVNVLLGQNGQGKTNLLESLIYLSTFNSHRVSAEAALMYFDTENQSGAERSVIGAKVVEGERSTLVELEIIRGRANKARLNRSPVRPREILGRLHTVTFAPEDLQILRSGPSGRRDFLDDLLIQNYPLFAAIKSDYEKILRQRAALLKAMAKGNSDQTSWQIWSERLAEGAARITANRVALLNKLRPWAVEAHELVAPEGKTLQLIYQAQVDEHESEAEVLAQIDPVNRPDLQDVSLLQERFLRQMHQRQREEVIRGANLVGSHRDDLQVTLDGLPVRGYASHGETWSAILAMRIGSFQMMRQESSDPVLILDDVFAELDTSRRQALAELVEGAEQVFITAAVREDLPEGLGQNFFHVQLLPETGSVVKPVA